MICFPIYEPEGIRVLDHDLAIRSGAANAFREKCTINRNILACKQPDRDLGFVAVEGATLEASSFVRKTHDGSSFRASAADVASIDPKMPGAQPVYTPRADNDGTFCHKYFLPSTCLGECIRMRGLNESY